MSIEAGLKKLPTLTAGLILDEIYYNPRFALHIRPLLAEKNTYKAVYVDMMKALNNEFEPSVYPETRGLWAVSRSRAKVFVARSSSLADTQMTGLGLTFKLPVVSIMSIKGKMIPVARGTGFYLKKEKPIAFEEWARKTWKPGIPTKWIPRPKGTWGLKSEDELDGIFKYHRGPYKQMRTEYKGEIRSIQEKAAAKLIKEWNDMWRGYVGKNRGVTSDTYRKARMLVWKGYLEQSGQEAIPETLRVLMSKVSSKKMSETLDKMYPAVRKGIKAKARAPLKRLMSSLAIMVAAIVVLPAIVGGGAAGGAAGAGSASAGASGAGAGLLSTQKLVSLGVKTGLDAAKKAKAKKEAEKAEEKATAKASAEEAAAQEEIKKIEEETARIEAETAAAEEAAAKAVAAREEISRIKATTELTPSEEATVVSHVKSEYGNIVINKVDGLMPEEISGFVKKTGRQPTPEEIKTIRNDLTARLAEGYGSAMIDNQTDATKKMFAREKLTLPLIVAGVAIPAVLLSTSLLRRRT